MRLFPYKTPAVFIIIVVHTVCTCLWDSEATFLWMAQYIPQIALKFLYILRLLLMMVKH